MKVSCIILAGGRSTRMGKDKKSLMFRGKTFLEHAVEVARTLSDEVTVSVGNREQIAEVESLGLKGVSIAVDILPGKGPLMGLYSALRKSSREYAVVMPCDSPSLDPKVYRLMITERQGYDAVIPRSGELIEPLHAVYRVKPTIRALEDAIRSREWELHKAVLRLKTKYIMASFHNVNTLEDLEKLYELENRRQDEGFS